MRVLIPLACILAAAFAAAPVFEWKGANTNWNTKSNWVGTVPSDGCPASIDLTGNTLNLAVKPTITSRLDGEIVAGGSIKFPSNGRIILSDASKIKFNPDCTDTAAVFKGGMTNTKENSLNCKSNYFLNGAPAKRTPCEGDIILVPADKTVRVWATDRVNVDGIKFGSTTFETCQSIAADASVSSQLTGVAGVVCGRSGNFLIKDTDPCTAAKEVDDEGKCLCFENPECLTDKEIRDQAQEERDAAEQLAIAKQLALSVNVTKTFTGTFTAASLGVTAADLLLLKNDPTALESFILKLRQALADAWGVPLSQVQITKFDISPDGLSVAIEGTVVAPKSAFIEAGQDPATVTDSTITLSGSQLTELQKIIRDTVAQQILKETLEIYGQQIADALAACNSVADCSGAFEFLQNLTAVFVDPAKVYKAIKDCPDAQCVANELSDDKTLKRQTDVTESDIQNVIDLFVALTIPITTDSPIDQFLTAATKAATSANDAATRQDALPKDTTVTSPNIEVGQNRPRSDLAHVISTVNAPTLKFALRFALSPFLIIKKVDAASISFDLKFKTARRRAVTDADLPVAIITKFNYMTSCNSADLRNCGFKSGDGVYKDVVIRINNVIDVFDLTSHHKCYDFQTGYDQACLQAEANLAYANAIKAKKTPAEALVIAKSTVYTIAECGEYGRKPDGTCIATDASVDALAESMAKIAQTNYKPTDNGNNNNGGGSQSSTGGSGGGGLPLPIIAGAAGGGVLIIIIVIIVVMRRKKNAGGDKPSDNRTVVAFENPMYDDPSQNAAQANYEATNEHGEGLYDEPAYNAQSTLAKSNPMYESTENIAGGDNYMAAGGEEGGYLDVAPDQQ